MHDFLLAKEIIDDVLRICDEKKMRNIKSVFLEIGSVALDHDGFPEHTEDISIENLLFGLRSIAEKTTLKNVDFIIKKINGENWKITNIEI